MRANEVVDELLLLACWKITRLASELDHVVGGSCGRWQPWSSDIVATARAVIAEAAGNLVGRSGTVRPRQNCQRRPMEGRMMMPPFAPSSRTPGTSAACSVIAIRASMPTRGLTEYDVYSLVIGAIVF